MAQQNPPLSNIPFQNKTHERMYHLCFKLLNESSSAESYYEHERFWCSQDDIGKQMVMKCLRKHLEKTLDFDPFEWSEDQIDRLAFSTAMTAIHNIKNPMLKLREPPTTKRQPRGPLASNRAKPPQQPVPSPLLERAIFRWAYEKQMATNIFLDF